MYPYISLGLTTEQPLVASGVNFPGGGGGWGVRVYATPVTGRAAAFIIRECRTVNRKPSLGIYGLQTHLLYC